MGHKLFPLQNHSMDRKGFLLKLIKRPVFCKKLDKPARKCLGNNFSIAMTDIWYLFELDKDFGTVFGSNVQYMHGLYGLAYHLGQRWLMIIPYSMIHPN